MSNMIFHRLQSIGNNPEKKKNSTACIQIQIGASAPEAEAEGEK